MTVRSAITVASIQFHAFQDLPAREGEAGRVDTAAPLRDCWLYLFRASASEIVFVHEVRVDASGRYQLVDLAAHRRENPRPPSGPLRDALTLEVAEALQGVVSPFNYWALFSRTQLHSTRLFDFGKNLRLTQDREKRAFYRWVTEERDLEPMFLDVKSTAKGAAGERIKHVWTPWAFAEALNRQRYEPLIAEWDALVFDPRRAELRQLVTAIEAIRKEVKDLWGCLDFEAYFAAKEKLEKEGSVRWSAELAARELVKYLNRPRFKNMMLDAYAHVEATHRREQILVLERAIKGLHRTPAGQGYLREFFENNQVVFSKELKLFKPTRKTVKGVFNFAKMFVTFADKGRAEWVPALVEHWSARYLGVRLLRDYSKVADDGIVRPGRDFDVPPAVARMGRKIPKEKRIQFTKQSVAELKAKVNERPLFNGIVFVLDGYNLSLAIGEYLEGEQTWSDFSSLVGSVSSALSSSIGVVGSALTPTKEEVAEVALLRSNRAAGKAMDWASHVRLGVLEEKTRSQLRNRVGLAVRRDLTNRAVKNFLGFVAGGADLIVSGYGAYREFDTGDTASGIWLTFTALGGAISAAGYFVTVWPSPPVGAALVAFGSLLGAIGEVGKTFFSSTEYEDWLRHCLWGTERHSTSTGKEWWSDLPLHELHENVAAQLRAFEAITFAPKLSCDFERNLKLPGTATHGFAFRMKVRRFYNASKVHLGVRARGRAGEEVLRPFSEWHGRLELREDASVAAVEQYFTMAGVEEVVATYQIDVFGNGTLLYPPAPATKTFGLSVLDL
jgi:hypothetical protein